MNDDTTANELKRPVDVKIALNSSVNIWIPSITSKMIILLVFILLLNQTVSIDPSSALYQEVFSYHNETSKKAEFASEVVNLIYNSFHQWFFTVTFCEFTYFENRILKYTENYGYGYNVMLLNGCPSSNRSIVKPKINKHGKTAYLVTANELTLDGSEFVIDALTRTGVFKPRSAVIFVVNVEVELDRYFYFMVKNHFQLLWSRRITNSVLIIKSNKLRMYTYSPFIDEVKDITDVKDVSDLLADQYNDLYGFELRLSVFRKIFVSDEAGPIKCDTELAKTVMKFLNATCVPVPTRDASTVGDLLDNGTATGVTGDLMDGYTDLELSSRILKNSYYGYIDTTYPLVQDELCFLVKKADMQSAFNTTMKLISMNIFLLFVFTVVIFLVITISVRKVERNILRIKDKQSAGATLIDLIKCFIRQTVDFKFIGPTFRCLVLLIIIYSLIIDCAIDGILISAITYPRNKPDINTMSDLIKSNRTLGVHNRDFNIFNKCLSIEDYETLKYRIDIFTDQKIKEVIDKRQYQYATLLRKTDSQYISRKPANMYRGKPLFYTMPDCPLPCFVVYGLRYGSPYLPRINYILSHLNQGGILQHWSQTEMYKLRGSLFTQENKENRPLNITNLQEVFYVLLIGEFISSIIFICEIVLHRMLNN